MRRALLIKSAQRVLGEGSTVSNAVYMWHRTNLWLAFVLAAAVVGFGVSRAIGIDGTDSVLIGIGLGAIASAASTRYFVLARDGDAIVLMNGSPVRRVATKVVRKDLRPKDISPAGNTMLATDWMVGKKVYTVPKSCDQDMQAVIAEQSRAKP